MFFSKENEADSKTTCRKSSPEVFCNYFLGILKNFPKNKQCTFSNTVMVNLLIHWKKAPSFLGTFQDFLEHLLVFTNTYEQLQQKSVLIGRFTSLYIQRTTYSFSENFQREKKLLFIKVSNLAITCTKLTIKTLKRRHWRCSDFLLLTLNKFHTLF